MTDKIIRGAFFGLFGSPKPPKPFRAPDTLNSKQFATLQDLISEGEIEGFATPSKAGLTKNTTAYNNAALKDVFLNNTPVLSENASNTNPQSADFNFQDVGFTPRFGTDNQTHISGIQQSQSPLAGFGPVLCSKANNGVQRDLPTGKDAVKITVTFNQIQKATDKGDLLGSSVTLKISLKVNSETTHTEKLRDTITGRTADAYSKEYRIDLPDGYTFANVSIERVTDDQPSGGNTVDAFNVSLIQLLIDDKQTYPNSAYTNLRIDSEQFSSIPDRAYRIRGVKVRIPDASASVVSATYTQSTTVVTVNNNNHGLFVGESVVFTAISGAGVNGTFVIQTVPDVNSFTLTSSTSQTVTTSNCTFAGTPNVDLATGRIRYPSGYIFNGTMGAAQWCSCPALILLDLLTTERYGFGTHIKDANLDLFSFIAASKYANELVDDGFGGKEARFSCNVNIQGSSDAFKLINELAGVMRCFPIWSEGSVFLSQDRPTDPTYLFSLANVGEGGFSYSGSSLKQRNTVINVSFFNMDSREIDYEVVGDDVSGPNALQEDIDRQAKLGIVKKDIKAFACTSRGQARRLGKAILSSQQNESEIVTFTTSIDSGAIVRPGSVISINDPVRGGERRSGRIKSATTTAITVDNVKDLSTFTGSNKKCSVIMPNGSVETKNITGTINDVITLDSALSTTPNVNSIWLIQSSTLEAQTFRVITVEEKDGINFTITALTYIDGKYAAIDSMQGINLPAKNISLLNQLKQPPANLQASERIVVINALAVSKLILSWVSVTGVSQYLVQYRFNSTNWVSEIVFRPDFEILNTEAGSYEFRVFSYNSGLKLSATSTDITFNAVGKTDAPGNVQNLSMEPITNKLVRLRWIQSVDPDVLHGGRVYVRHSNLTDGSGTFQNSVDLVTALAGNTTDVIVPSLEGEYILKFQDDQGNFSTGEASIILDLPDLIDTQVILQDREDLDSPSFQGTKTNTTFNNITSALQLIDPSVVKTGTYSQSGTTITITSTSHGIAVGENLPFRFLGGDAVNRSYVIDSVPNANTLTITSHKSVTTSGNVSIDRGLRGEYAFKDVLDLGDVFSLDLKRVIRSVGFNIGTDIETIIPNDPPELGGPPNGGWDNYATDGNFDGPAANEANCQMQVATSQTASGSFGSFNNFANGTFKGRRFKFKLILETTNTAQNMNVQQAGYTAEFESRTEQNYKTGGSTSTLPQNSGTSASGLDVTFATPFFVGVSGLGGLNQFKPSVGITIMGAAAGEYFVIKTDSNGDFLNAAGNIVTGTGFNIKILDSSNNPVNKKFTFQAVGYGKGV